MAELLLKVCFTVSNVKSRFREYTEPVQACSFGIEEDTTLIIERNSLVKEENLVKAYETYLNGD